MVKVVVSAGSEDTSPANFIFPHLLLPLTLTSARSFTPNHHLPPPAPPSPPPLPPSSTPITANHVPSPQPFPLLSLLDGSNSNGSDHPSLLQPIFISCPTPSLDLLDLIAALNHYNLPDLDLDFVVFQAARSSLPDLPSSTPPASSPSNPHPRPQMSPPQSHLSSAFPQTLDCTSDVFAYTSLITAFARLTAIVGECTTR